MLGGIGRRGRYGETQGAVERMLIPGCGGVLPGVIQHDYLHASACSTDYFEGAWMNDGGCHCDSQRQQKPRQDQAG